MTISDEIDGLRVDRDSIRSAIVGKGGTLPEGSPMSAYPAAISNLPSGGGGEFLELTYTSGYVSSALTDEAKLLAFLTVGMTAFCRASILRSSESTKINRVTT